MRTFEEFIIVCLVLTVLFVILVLTSGCAALTGRTSQDIITEPPTPGVQLWNAAKKSNWLVTASILGIAAGVFALSNGATKLGFASIASGSVSLFMSLAVARYSAWMAVLGLTGSIAAALFSILARRKALVEIIKGVQKFKDGYSEQSDARQNILTKLSEQSPTTKRIVSNVKSELRLKGAI